MVDTGQLSGYSVYYGSTIKANSAFHPSRVGKGVVVVHEFTWITGVETI